MPWPEPFSVHTGTDQSCSNPSGTILFLNITVLDEKAQALIKGGICLLNTPTDQLVSGEPEKVVRIRASPTKLNSSELKSSKPLVLALPLV